MITDVTTTWQQGRAAHGLYVVRGRSEPHRNVMRVGVAGVRGGTLISRLKRHLAPPPKEKNCGTHDCQPFEGVLAWGLIDWTMFELANGEHCLYRAFAVRFPRRTVGLPDESLFIVSESADLAPALAELRADLEAIERLRR